MASVYYEDEWAVVYHGDCREVVPSVHADVLVTDPPYGIGHASNRVAPTTTAEWMNQEIAGDGCVSLRDEVLSGFSEWCVFGSPDAPAPSGMRGTLIWDKGPASGMGDLSFPWKKSWELIYVAGEGWSGSRDEGVLKNMWVVTRASMGRRHPNEKPVDLLTYLLMKHSGRVVLDPFMGSGTTLVAAKSLGRKSIGVELEERYCEVAAERLSQGVLELV